MRKYRKKLYIKDGNTFLILHNKSRKMKGERKLRQPTIQNASSVIFAKKYGYSTGICTMANISRDNVSFLRSIKLYF